MTAIALDIAASGYLVQADVRKKGADTLLGNLWWVLDPLLQMAVYVILVSVIFHRDKPDYPVFIFAALGIGALETLVVGGYEFVKVIEKYRKRGATTGGIYRGAIGSLTDHSLPHDTGLNVASITAESCGVAYFQGSSIPSAYA